MSNKYEINKKKLPPGVYHFYYDENSKGVYLMDGHGFIPEKEEIIEAAKGLTNFANYYSQKDIDQYNKSNLKEEIVVNYTLRERKKKNGYIFIYRELGTNLYRFGVTKDLNERMIALNNSSPLTLKIIFLIVMNI